MTLGNAELKSNELECLVEEISEQQSLKWGCLSYVHPTIVF
jgi:hypothetical protein